MSAKRKRPTEYERAALRRIERAEADGFATILRAIDRTLHVLVRERRGWGAIRKTS